MKTELIPVLELHYDVPTITTPQNVPFWKFPEAWDQYQRQCLNEAGYSSTIKPYLPGYPFFVISSLNEQDVTIAVAEHTKDFRADGYTREEASAFFGGYILRVDGQDKYFPQCCSDLSDIYSWKGLSTGSADGFWAGHPQPSIKIVKDRIFFDLREDKHGEKFGPPPPELLFNVTQLSLRDAVATAEKVLADFSLLLKKINIKSNFRIDEIDKLLIWDDREG